MSFFFHFLLDVIILFSLEFASIHCCWGGVHFNSLTPIHYCGPLTRLAGLNIFKQRLSSFPYFSFLCTDIINLSPTPPHPKINLSIQHQHQNNMHSFKILIMALSFILAFAAVEVEAGDFVKSCENIRLAVGPLMMLKANCRGGLPNYEYHDTSLRLSNCLMNLSGNLAVSSQGIPFILALLCFFCGCLFTLQLTSSNFSLCSLYFIFFLMYGSLPSSISFVSCLSERSGNEAQAPSFFPSFHLSNSFTLLS